MRIVIDTNVLISGIFFTGIPSLIFDGWLKEKFVLVVSEPILSEYIKVFERIAQKIRTKAPDLDIFKIIEMVILKAEVVDTENIHVTVCEDSDDNKFIECAIAGKCTLIVTGDKDLLRIGTYQGIKILTPRTFWDTYLK